MACANPVTAAPRSDGNGGPTMQIIRFANDQKPESLDRLEQLPADGYVWLDFVREDAPDWKAEVERLTGVKAYEPHVVDSMNPDHPSISESTDCYEMIIFRGLASDEIDSFTSRPTVFFLFEKLLVTVRARESSSVVAVMDRLLERTVRIPRRGAGLLLLVLSAMVDRFMALREPLATRMEEWQDALLDPANPFDDWMSLLRQRNRLQRLERMCDEQADALNAWCEDTIQELDASLTVRLNDVLEHIRRVRTHAQHLESHLESMVQIHFAAVAHRTNDIMRVLTVLTAVKQDVLEFLSGDHSAFELRLIDF
jgi:magnesium transporter